MSEFSLRDLTRLHLEIMSSKKITLAGIKQLLLKLISRVIWHENTQIKQWLLSCS